MSNPFGPRGPAEGGAASGRSASRRARPREGPALPPAAGSARVGAIANDEDGSRRMSHPVSGVDHAFVLTRALEEAAEAWRAMGFTLSPRGLHSAAKGTANHTIMFERDYFELLGVIADTPENASRREMLARTGPGLHAVACRVEDARGAGPALAELGIATCDYGEFSRPVDLPEGGTGEAAFATLSFDEAEVPGGMMFMCEHRTRAMVWRPELMEHANGARGLAGIVAVRSDPEPAARAFARLFALGAVSEAPEGLVVATGLASAPILVVTPDAFAGLWPEHDLDATPREAFAALRVRVADAEAAREALRRGGVPHAETERGASVGPEHAGGVVVDLVAS